MDEFPRLKPFGSSAKTASGVRCDIPKFRADAIAKANAIATSVNSMCGRMDEMQARMKELFRRTKGTTDAAKRLKWGRKYDALKTQRDRLAEQCKAITNEYETMKDEYARVAAFPDPKTDEKKEQLARLYTQIILNLDRLVLDCRTGNPRGDTEFLQEMRMAVDRTKSVEEMAQIRDAYAGGPRQACAGNDFAASDREYDKIPCDTCEHAHFACYDFGDIFRQRHKDVYDLVANHGTAKKAFDLYDLQQALGCLDRRAQFAFWASSQLISENLHNILINTCKKSRGALNDPSNRITETGTATALHELCRHLHKLGFKFLMKGNKVKRVEVPGCPQFKGNLFRVEYRPNQVIRALQTPKCIADALTSSKAACKKPECKPLVGFSGYQDAPACEDEAECKPVPRVIKARCGSNRAGNEGAIKQETVVV